jgi:hypothetical protein
MNLNFRLLILGCCLTLFATAQDILIKKNGDEINCKVLELTSEAISYSLKAASDSLVPETLLVKKNEVFMIRYSNGTKDVFNVSPVEPAAPAPIETAYVDEPAPSEKIDVKGRKFYYRDRKISNSRVVKILRNEKDPKISPFVTKSVVCSVFAPILKFVSIPAGIIGFILVGFEANDLNQNNDIQNRNVATGFLTGFVLGQAGGYTVEHFQYKNLKEAVKIYNNKH